MSRMFKYVYSVSHAIRPICCVICLVYDACCTLSACAVLSVQLVNRSKNNKKKKSPTPLTEDMLNELNKNHMSGLDNCGADDLYNMDDVWNDKPPKKVTFTHL